MSTTALGGTTTGVSRRQDRLARTGQARFEVGRVGIGTVGAVTVLISAWGGIIPYIGPLFGYSADGSGSWQWNLSHGVLNLVPGAIGFFIGLLILGETRGVVVGRGRVSLAMAGSIALICAAWFIVGPLAWPVITNHGAYFVTSVSPLRNLENQVGYSLGTGFVLAACGAFTMGWAARHQVKTLVPATPNDSYPNGSYTEPAQPVEVVLVAKKGVRSWRTDQRQLCRRPTSSNS